MNGILASVSNALAMDLSEGYEDSIPTWPSVSLPPQAPPPRDVLKLKLANQVLGINGATRLARVRANKTPVDRNPWIRTGWILQNWVAFSHVGEPVEHAGMNLDYDDLGLCHLTDETAASVIEHSFKMEEYSTKQFRDFRKKYNLLQVPKIYRMAGFMVNGCLKIERKGRKRI